MKKQTPKGLTAYFITHPVTANLLMLFLLVAGITTATGLRKQGMPTLEPDTITVSVTYESGSARQTEEGVAIKIEEAVKDLSGIKKIRSTSTDTEAEITITKTDRQDLGDLYSDIKGKIDAIANLPTDAEKPVITKATMEDHVIWVQLYGSVAPDVLRDLGLRLKRDLLDQPDVGKIATTGVQDAVMAIEVSRKTLEHRNLTLSEVAEKVAAESLVATSGELRGEGGTKKIRAARQRHDVAGFAEIPVSTDATGQNLTLGEIAVIRDTVAETPVTLSRFQGKPSVGLQVMVAEGGDILASVKEVRKVVANWKESGRLPEELHLATWYDQSSMSRDRLRLLGKNGLSGILLIFLVLALTLNLKVALYVALGIPVSIAGALFMMGEGLLNVSLNELSTFGFILALGILVDDGVVIGESIYTTRKAEGDTIESTIKGVHKVALPTVFGVLTTIAAFYPLSLISGHMGKLYASFTTIVVCCLLFSLLESKLVLPSHLAHIDTRDIEPTHALPRAWSLLRNFVEHGIAFLRDRLYRPALAILLKQRYAALLLFATLLVLAASLVAGGRVRAVFFPDIPRSVIAADFTLSEEAGAELALAHALRIEKAAGFVDARLRNRLGRTTPLILNVQTVVASATSGSITAELAADSPVSSNEIASAWRESTGALEATRSLVFSSGWKGDDAFRIEIASSNTDQLLPAGKRIRTFLSTLPGVQDIQDNLDPDKPQIDLELTPEGRAMGLDSSTLAQLVRKGFFGHEVQSFQRGDREVKVKVRFPADERTSMADLLDTRITLANGTTVPLSMVARVTSGFTESSIYRHDRRQSVYITSGLDKNLTDATGVIQQLKERLLPELSVQYPGIQFRFAGEFEQKQETAGSMEKLFLLSLFVIYALLAIPLGSYTQPVLVMTAIPFGIVGAILGHLLHGLPLSMLSFMGMLALSGVVVNDSLLLVSHYNGLRKDGLSVREALLETGPSRLRAILLTSVTTFIGLVPLVQETTVQAQFLIPAAVSLAYGVGFGTLITLFLMPVLLHVREDIAAFLPGRKS